MSESEDGVDADGFLQLAELLNDLVEADWEDIEFLIDTMCRQQGSQRWVSELASNLDQVLPHGQPPRLLAAIAGADRDEEESPQLAIEKLTTDSQRWLQRLNRRYSETLQTGMHRLANGDKDWYALRARDATIGGRRPGVEIVVELLDGTSISVVTDAGGYIRLLRSLARDAIRLAETRETEFREEMAEEWAGAKVQMDQLGRLFEAAADADRASTTSADGGSE